MTMKNQVTSREQENEIASKVAADRECTSATTLEERVLSLESFTKSLELRFKEEMGEVHERIEELEYPDYPEESSVSTVIGLRFVLSPDAFTLAYNSLYEASIFQMHSYPPATEADGSYYAEKCGLLMKFLFDVLDLTEEEEMFALSQVFGTWVEWNKSQNGQVPKTPPPLSPTWFGYLLENVASDIEMEDEE